MMKELPINEILCGDCVSVMKELPKESVDLVVTSPPYWGLRDYGVDGQIGLEDHPNRYIESLVLVAKQVKRVLKKSGSFYLNLGDTYCSIGSKRFGGVVNYDYSVLGKNQLDNQGRGRITKEQQGKWLQPKQLMLIPSRTAIALQHDGWILRNDIVWYKPNHMPSSVTDRLTNSWEHVFHFVKNRKYFYDLDAIRTKHIWAKTDSRSKLRRVEGKSGKITNGTYATNAVGYNPKGKNPGDIRKIEHTAEFFIQKGSGGNVNLPSSTHPQGKNPSDFWKVTTKPFKGAHFATFPPNLIKPMIKSSCPEDGVVLDPFCGSGTALVVAHKLGRKWVGIDLNPEYCELARKRLEGVGAFSAKIEDFVRVGGKK